MDKHQLKYTTLINEAQTIAIQSLKNFFELLDFDSEAFNHLYNISMKIDKLGEEIAAEYAPDENYIIINSTHLEEMLELIDESQNDENTKNKVILNMAFTLVHEILHANRAIIIEDGLNLTTIAEKEKDELSNFSQKKSGHDLNQYNFLLSGMLSKPFIVEFEQFIPIKARLNKDGSYTIIAYNLKTKDYNEFSNQYFEAINNGDIDKFLYQIGIELNNGKTKHKITNVIYSFVNDNNHPEIVLGNEYYHPYSNRGRILNQNSLSSQDEYKNLLEEKTDKIFSRLVLSNGFEETITDVLAMIIIKTRNKKELDLNAITTEIFNSSDSVPNEKSMLKLIQAVGIDLIKWFLTSAYTSYYNDFLEKIFQERYDDLLFDFDDLYETTRNQEEVDQFSIDDIQEIIEKKVRR